LPAAHDSPDRCVSSGQTIVRRGMRSERRGHCGPEEQARNELPRYSWWCGSTVMSSSGEPVKAAQALFVLGVLGCRPNELRVVSSNKTGGHLRLSPRAAAAHSPPRRRSTASPRCSPQQFRAAAGTTASTGDLPLTHLGREPRRYSPAVPSGAPEGGTTFLPVGPVPTRRGNRSARS
jgi:hypothetical protein